MKKLSAVLLALVMLLSMLPMTVFAEEPLPVVTIETDKTTVLKGETLSLTMKLTGDIADEVTLWQWNFVWDSTYFAPVSATVGDAVQSESVTPIVNFENPMTQMAAPYACATVTSGNTVAGHTLKAGTIATLTLVAKQDVSTEANAKFYLDDVIVAASNGQPMQVVASDSAMEWGDDNNQLPGEGVGLSVAIKAAVDVTDIQLNKTELTMKIGEKATLLATVLPENATSKTVTWTSSSVSIATVVEGVVTAVASGNATITVKIGGIETTCNVTVTAQEEGSATQPTQPTSGNTTNLEPDDNNGGFIWIIVAFVAVALVGILVFVNAKRKK